MSETTLNERDSQEDRLVFAMQEASALMEHLDRTWWLRSDVSNRLQVLIEYLKDAEAAARALLSAGTGAP